MLYNVQFTVIRENFVVKNFSVHPKRPKFLTRILFTNSIIRSKLIWRTREIDENIVTRKFLT